MKKICLSVIAVTGIVLAPFSFAESQAIGGYYSSLQSQAASTSSPSLAASAAPVAKANVAFVDTKTKILITNSSRTAIQVEVQGTSIKDYLHTNTMDYIRNGSYAGDTYIVLKDAWGNQFWGGNVCNHAIIDINNVPNTYNYNIDVDRYCR
jgi:hypothetical protein